MESRTIARTEKREAVEIAALTGLFVAVFARFVPDLIEAWIDRPDSSHGWLIAPLAFWIFWLRREWVREAPARTWTPGLAVVAIGLMAAVISARTGLDTLGRVAL